MNGNATIYFLRHGRVLLPYADHSEMPFSVLAQLGLKQLDPALDLQDAKVRIERLRDAVPFSDVISVYTSPARRTHESGDLLASLAHGDKPHACITLPLLREVDFDLMKLDTLFNIQDGIKSHGISAVNSAVFSGMVSDRYCESAEAAYRRVETLFEFIRTLKAGCYVFVTHDFFMRVIEIYIRRQGTPYAAITVEDLEKTQRNLYFTGYVTDAALYSFRAIQ